MDSIGLSAPAKLNLWLKLTGPVRPDGRHELRSHFAPLRLADRLVLRSAERFGLSCSGPFAAGLPSDGRNLLWKAYAGFSRDFITLPPVHIDLDKQIPHSAGLGGGSSDAGTLLKYLAARYEVPLAEVRDWSLGLGADLPAAIGPHCGLVQGVGERLGVHLAPPAGRVLLVTPRQGCPTGAVFAALARAEPPPEVCRNDLEMAARLVCPALGPILDYLRTDLDLQAQITGSGATCFALLPEEDGGCDQRLKTALDKIPGDPWVCLTDFEQAA